MDYGEIHGMKNNMIQNTNRFAGLITDEDFSTVVSVYSSLMHEYSIRICSNICNEPIHESIDKGFALECAVFLSSLRSGPFVEQAWLMAQEMVAMLCSLYPDDAEVQYFSGMVLNNVGNYKGVSHVCPEYRSSDILEQVTEEYLKSELAIPGLENEHYFIPQKIILDHFGDSCFSYSAPTSMGKSLIIKEFIRQKIESGCQSNFAIIVPSRALINENSKELSYTLGEMLHEEKYRVVENNGAAAFDTDNSLICVMTPERFLRLLNTNQEVNFGVVFIDEAHRISINDSRSAVYYQILNLLPKETKVIFSSPYIPNPDVYLNLIKGKKDKSRHSYVTQFSPVCQLKMIVNIKSEELISFNAYSMESKVESRLLEKINLTSLVSALGDGKQNIIYINGKKMVIEEALKYAENKPYLNDPELDGLAEDIRRIIHPDYHLADLVRKGVAFHIGYLPSVIRVRIEELFKGNSGEHGKINTVFCTSTLLEGVNLPCANLFVCDYKKGKNTEMNEIDFRNLIGRAGRIRYNISGNVFFVCIPNISSADKFVKKLQKPVRPQRLSVLSALDYEQKKRIVDSIKNGQYEFGRNVDQDDEEFSRDRRFATMLLKDIIAGRETYITKQFEAFLSESDKNEIRERFEFRRDEIDEEIDISQDQHDRLVKRLQESNLRYPKINGMVPNGRDVLGFLLDLLDVFKWDIYERHTLGYWNEKEKRYSKLSWYSLVLCKWMAGNSLKEILEDQIDYYKMIGADAINQKAGDLMEALDRIIQFKLGNYFKKFSRELRRLFPNESFQDWSEFVEFGGINPIQIFLQKNGFSREVAITILRGHIKYIDRKEYVIKKEIFNCDNHHIRDEALLVWKWNPDLFDGSPSFVD